MPINIEITAYSFDELGNSAKERALHNWQTNSEFPWDYDYRQSLEKLEKDLGVSVDWEYRGEFQFSIPTTSWTQGFTLKDAQNLKGSGFCAGESLIETFQEVFKRQGSARIALDSALTKFFKEWEEDRDWFFSEAGFRDHIDACYDTQYIFDILGGIIA